MPSNTPWESWGPGPGDPHEPGGPPRAGGPNGAGGHQGSAGHPYGGPQGPDDAHRDGYGHDAGYGRPGPEYRDYPDPGGHGRHPYGPYESAPDTHRHAAEPGPDGGDPGGYRHDPGPYWAEPYPDPGYGHDPRPPGPHDVPPGAAQHAYGDRPAPYGGPGADHPGHASAHTVGPSGGHGHSGHSGHPPAHGGAHAGAYAGGPGGVGPGGPTGTGPGRGAPGTRQSARAGRHPGTPADGTYVPEGGASPTGPGGLREWPAAVVLGLLAVSLVAAAVLGFRAATLMIGATFVVSATLRVCVREVGVLAVRSRFTDVMVMLTFGTAVVLLGLMVPPPLVDLPWVPKRTG